jgi:RNA polymerase-associated protein CTR9
MSSIEIPLKNKANEVLEIVLDELPFEAQQIINILREEEVPLEIWLRFAVEYFRRSRPDAFNDILTAALSPELAHVYSRQTHEKIVILNAIGAYYIGLAAKEKVGWPLLLL